MQYGFEVYKNIFHSQNRPGQANLNSVSKHPWDLISVLDCRKPNNFSSTCSLPPWGSNLEAELSSSEGMYTFWLAEGQRSPIYKLHLSPLKLGKHKPYASWKKMKLCFLEGSWPLFARQSHLISESFSVSVKEWAVEPPLVWPFDTGLWRHTDLLWVDLDAETGKSSYWISPQNAPDMCDKVCSYLYKAVVSLHRFKDLYIRSSFCEGSPLLYASKTWHPLPLSVLCVSIPLGRANPRQAHKQ